MVYSEMQRVGIYLLVMLAASLLIYMHTLHTVV